MHKILTATTATLALMAASVTHAGNLTFEPDIAPPVHIEPDEPMGGSNAKWIIPLLAIGVIGLAISSGGGDDDDDEKADPKPEPEPDPCKGASLSFEPYQVATKGHYPPPPNPCD